LPVLSSSECSASARAPFAETSSFLADPRQVRGGTGKRIAVRRSNLEDEMARTFMWSGVLAAGLAVSGSQSAAPLATLIVPAGFQIEVFAENVGNARSMALGPQGTCSSGRSTPATSTPSSIATGITRPIRC
jgi:hypothetical protein